MIKRQINVLGERPTVAELLDYYGRDEAGKIIGFQKVVIGNGDEMAKHDIRDGYVVFVPGSGPNADIFISHESALYFIPKHEMEWFNSRPKLPKLPKDNLGTYFMLYQVLEDILKIDRFDMADHEHAESFKFAQEVLNKCKNDR